MGTIILEVENLSVVFDEKTVLKDISFSLVHGETLAIVGPNGAGKTVLFNALLGKPPYTGTIRWQDSAVIEYVPQRFGLDSQVPLSVQEFFLCKAGRFWFPQQAFLRHLGRELSAVGLTRSILKRQLRFGSLPDFYWQPLRMKFAIQGCGVNPTWRCF